MTLMKSDVTSPTEMLDLVSCQSTDLISCLWLLNFLPIESVDPFSGVIVMGYGTPPGGGSSYRATVYVQDPALEARSLRVALASRGGPVSAETQRAVEDAILTRARQLRIANGRL